MLQIMFWYIHFNKEYVDAFLVFLYSNRKLPHDLILIKTQNMSPIKTRLKRDSKILTGSCSGWQHVCTNKILVHISAFSFTRNWSINHQGWFTHVIHTELQNVNSFTRSKTFRLNLTPRKVRKSRLLWHLNWTSWTSLYTEILQQLCKSS